ncbi:MAG: hypothetical protein ABW252_04330 [Polyangiales bacterium]
MRVLRATWLVSALQLLAACLQERGPTTAIDVSVKSDLALTELTYSVFAPDADPVRGTPEVQRTATGEGLARPLVIERGRHRTVRVRIEGRTAQGSIVHEALARFDEAHTTALRVFLASACLGKVCGAGETCFGRLEEGAAPGTCAPVRLRDDLVRVQQPGDESAWRAPEAAMPVSEPARPAATCAVRDNLACDPLRDCGCRGGQHCQLHAGTPECTNVGKKPVDAVCQVDAECAAGLACGPARTCAPPCDSDASCGGGTCARQPDEVFGTCLRACSASVRCAPGIACSPLKWDDTFAGTACFNPLMLCPHRRDNRCDEPGIGSGLCVAGSDHEDCACDEVTQRGCPADQMCSALEQMPGVVDRVCGPAGSGPMGSPCVEHGECGRGLTCVSALCHRYCDSRADCSDGASCIRVYVGDAFEASIQICRLECTLSEGAAGTCRTGSRCVPADDVVRGGVCERIE